MVRLFAAVLLLAAAVPILAQGSSSSFIVQYKPDERNQVRLSCGNSRLHILLL